MLKTLGVCVVLLVVSIPIALHVVLAFIKDFSGMDMLCSDKTVTLTQNIITIESKLPWCKTSEQVLLSFALLAAEWTHSAKDVVDHLYLFGSFSSNKVN